MKKQFFGFGIMALAVMFANTAMAGTTSVELNSWSGELESCGGSARATYVPGSGNLNFAIRGTQQCAFVDLDGQTYRLSDSGGQQNRSGSVSLPIRELNEGKNTIAITVHSKTRAHSDTVMVSVFKLPNAPCAQEAYDVMVNEGYRNASLSYAGTSGSGNYKYHVSGLGTLIMRKGSCSKADIQRGQFSDAGSQSYDAAPAADAANALL